MRHLRGISVFVWLLFALSPAAAELPSALTARLDASLSVPSLRGARVGALVVRESDGAVLYARDADRAMVPASNMKILTAIAVLSQRGPTHRFETRVLADGPLDAEGEVNTLYVVGDGDPALNSEDWWQLVAGLSRAGVKKIAGDVVLDGSVFDGQRWHPSWGRTSSRAYHAPVAGLTANYSAFAVHVRPGSSPGDAVDVKIDPPVDYLRVSNRAQTGSVRSRSTVSVDRMAGGTGESVTIDGVVPAGAPPRVFYRSVLDPVAYAGSVLRWQLESQGIEVAGRVRSGRIAPGAELLFSFEGRSLSEIVQLFVKHSNNSVAEALVKTLGRQDSGEPGSWNEGVPALRRTFESMGVFLDGSRFVDGSGLSYENRISPRTLVEALSAARRSFHYGPELIAALPIAGQDGTLARRTKQSRGRVRAKTGLLTRVTGLSGYAWTDDGEELVFSILVNGYRGSDEEAMAAVDGFAEALTR